MSPEARKLYDRFVSLIARCGEYHVAPAKTRIAFLARVRFAGARRVSGDTIAFGFSLPKPVRSSRLTEVTEVVPGWWSHELVVSDPKELDAEVARWIRDSHHLMGMQERPMSKPAGNR